MKIFKIITYFIIATLIISCSKEKDRICEIYEGEVGYAIGTFDSYISTPLKITYKYLYTVDGIEYSGKEKVYGISTDNDYLLGKNCVVIYELSDISNSDINTNYFIESDSDFQEFLNEYPTTPPSPDFPTDCE